MPLLRLLAQRETGLPALPRVESWYQRRRLASLQISPLRSVASPHASVVSSLSLEPAEHRYLLSTGVDMRIAVYDTFSSRSDAEPYTMTPLVTRLCGSSSTSHAVTGLQDHISAISSGVWYPVDSGAFVTGSFDQSVMVWDTNLMQPVSYSELRQPVHQVAMSPVAAQHSLIAAATRAPAVSLIDLRTGAFTHSLLGHREAVFCVQWSPRAPFLLASGAVDGTARVWDIRTSGSVVQLDQHNASRQERLPESRRIALDRRGHATAVTAHAASVHAVQWANSGSYLWTSGADERLRRWDVVTGHDTLVHYTGTHCRHTRAAQIACSDDDDLVFHPNWSAIGVYDSLSGKEVASLQGHYHDVTGCIWHPTQHQLYSSGRDAMICVYSPMWLNDHRDDQDVSGDERGVGDAGADDGDAWSSDDADNSDTAGGSVAMASLRQPRRGRGSGRGRGRGSSGRGSRRAGPVAARVTGIVRQRSGSSQSEQSRPRQRRRQHESDADRGSGGGFGSRGRRMFDPR